MKASNCTVSNSLDYSCGFTNRKCAVLSSLWFTCAHEDRVMNRSFVAAIFPVRSNKTGNIPHHLP